MRQIHLRLNPTKTRFSVAIAPLRTSANVPALHHWYDGRDKGPELLALRFSIASPVTHDKAIISKVRQASEVIHNVCLRTRASITAAVRGFPGLPNVDEELVTEAEVCQSLPLCLA